MWCVDVVDNTVVLGCENGNVEVSWNWNEIIVWSGKLNIKKHHTLCGYEVCTEHHTLCGYEVCTEHHTLCGYEVCTEHYTLCGYIPGVYSTPHTVWV